MLVLTFWPQGNTCSMARHPTITSFLGSLMATTPVRHLRLIMKYIMCVLNLAPSHHRIHPLCTSVTIMWLTTVVISASILSIYASIVCTVPAYLTIMWQWALHFQQFTSSDITILQVNDIYVCFSSLHGPPITAWTTTSDAPIRQLCQNMGPSRQKS